MPRLTRPLTERSTLHLLSWALRCAEDLVVSGFLDCWLKCQLVSIWVTYSRELEAFVARAAQLRPRL